MTFERTHDLVLVKFIMTHSKVWPMITDDLAGNPEDFQPVDHPATYYLLAKDGEHLLGVWVLNPENSVCWDVHTCLLPSAWGPIARQAVKEAMDWVWEHTQCRRVVTKVPYFNRVALRFAKLAGMVEYGVNPLSYLKHGVLHDQVLLGISRPERVCQPL